MCRNLVPAVLAVVAAALFAGPAQSQPTLGTYSYYWTTTANVPITAASVNPGDGLSVRLWIRETGGNVFDGTRTATSGAFAGLIVGGLGGFDSIFSVATGGTSLVRLNPPANPVVGQRYTGVTASSQFGGTPGGYFQQNVAPFNSTGTSPSFAQGASAQANPTTYVRDTVAPNTVTGSGATVERSIFLYQIDFQTGFAGSTTGTTTLTGGQGTGPNHGYYTDSNFSTLDANIALASAPLTINVVPEPASVMGLSALALAGLGLVRRRLTRAAV